MIETYAYESDLNRQVYGNFDRATVMITISVKNPESGLISKLKIRQVNNFVCPGWVVLIPGGKNVLLYRKDERWQIVPQNISTLYAEKIGEKLVELTL